MRIQPNRRCRVPLIACLFLLWVILTPILLVREKALFSSEGLRATVSDDYNSILRSESDKGDFRQTDKVDSREYRRDLIIVASVIDREGKPVRDDHLYAYVRGQGASHHCKDDGGRYNQLVPINGVPMGQFLSVVAGSSAIWPAYSRVEVEGIVPNLPVAYLIDGGFGHNSPVEAAVIWGATHIIVIDAGARENQSEGKLIHNGFQAFSFLFGEAQRIDTLARGNRRVYEIQPACHDCEGDSGYAERQNKWIAKLLHKKRVAELHNEWIAELRDKWIPSPERIDLFDFQRDAIHNTFERGKDHVSGPSAYRFQRLLGEPIFLD